jgi:hypothetical protein
VRNEKPHSTNRCGSIVGHPGAAGIYAIRSTLKHLRGGIMAALKVSFHKSPQYTETEALQGGANIKAAYNNT